MTKTHEEHRQKDCYGKARCWNNVRIQCPVADECKRIADQSRRETKKRIQT